MSESKLVLVLLLLLGLFLLAAAHGGDHDSDYDAGSGSDSGEKAPNLRAKSLILVKIWCLIIVFFGTFIGGISPYFLKWNEGFLVLGTQFAGGVFLGTAMMHFLSDANETFEDLTEVEYPFAFMLASAGYVITMLVDCFVSSLMSKGRSGGGFHGDAGRNGETFETEKGIVGTNSHAQSETEDSAHGHSAAKSLVYARSLGDSIMLIVALCFHSVFEGIAIGVAETKADAWKALWTVSLHKIFAAIAMGIALLRMIPDRPLLSCASYSFAFAISTPIGVAIGIIIDATTQGKVADWIYAISMGLACGIFIYVAINHLLSKGYMPLKNITADTPLNRWFAVVLGVGVIAVVMIWDT
ncbi:Zinc/iron permease protein [Dioscorea alata]|uniref:Zinc/iron permease protein n=1 Tax=Dioscorea alata TaxID=55571 RepID=A0ACB7UWL9_DIOAL|nr:Zinc/iron permease protein [Dioscorea alata]